MTTNDQEPTVRTHPRSPLRDPWAVRCGLFAILAVLALSAATAAQGRRPGPQAPIVRSPQVRATVAKIDVQVRERAATVELVQTLHNEGRRPAEATWMLPLPADASVDRFQMVVGGEVLDRLDGDAMERVRRLERGGDQIESAERLGELHPRFDAEPRSEGVGVVDRGRHPGSMTQLEQCRRAHPAVEMIVQDDQWAVGHDDGRV